MYINCIVVIVNILLARPGNSVDTHIQGESSKSTQSSRYDKN